jgi:uncharacterized protein
MIRIEVDGGRSVSALLQAPGGARACYVFAHGAGAGMTHPFMAAVAKGLAEREVATLRYQFPYMEQGSRRPDPPKLAHAAVRAAVAQAARSLPGVPAGKPSSERAQHLRDVKIPMLFLQGGRDALAELPRMQRVVQSLGARATLEVFPRADHSFRSAVLDELADKLAGWINAGNEPAGRSFPGR